MQAQLFFVILCFFAPSGENTLANTEKKYILILHIYNHLFPKSLGSQIQASCSMSHITMSSRSYLMPTLILKDNHFKGICYFFGIFIL